MTIRLFSLSDGRILTQRAYWFSLGIQYEVGGAMHAGVDEMR